MHRHQHDYIWRKWASKNNLPRPPKECLDANWVCIGVNGRFSCGEGFKMEMEDEDSILADEIIFETEANRN